MDRDYKIRIISVVLGICIFIFSVYIMLSVILNLLGLGNLSTFFGIGAVLFSSYKFSSILIPVILLYAAILLIVPGWPSHSKVVLAGSPIYFFSCVLGEHFVYFIIPKITNPAIQDFIKTAFILCTLLLVLFEIFLSLLIAEKKIKEKEPIVPKIENEEDIIGSEYNSEFFLQNTTVSETYPEYAELQNVNVNDTESDNIGKLETFENIQNEDNQNILENDTDDQEVKPTSYSSLIDSLVVIEEPFDIQNKADNIEVKEEKTEEINSIKEYGEYGFADKSQLTVSENIDKTQSLVSDNVTEENEVQIIQENIPDEISNEQISDAEIENHAEDETYSGQGEFNDNTENGNFDAEDCTEEDLEETEDTEETEIEITAAQPLLPKIQEKQKGYHIPYELLTKYPGNEYWIIDETTRNAAFTLKKTFEEFNINIEITGIRKGPVVTMFEVLPPPGIKLGKITALQDNIALRLAAQSVRMVAPIPGKQAVGIEVPNKSRAIVGFRELIETEIPETKKMEIPIVLGKDVTGEPQTLDLCQTPHLLIAGATGSGKSVCVNTIILSILYNKSPEQVKLLLVDPKIVELKLYNGIGHLLTPVITEPKKALQGLQYCICEMERRYAMLDGMSVRDIKSYNKKIRREKLAAETLPYIVIIIDEFADLMATTGKELEATVSRLCAMSRAVGIHLVLATQRPSTNVITGLIKANIPSRIAFMVASRVDSQIILDNNGAEKLLGKGDMLYVSTATPFPGRIQGTFVSDEEVEQVVECVKTFGEPEYIDDEIFFEEEDYSQSSLSEDDSDPLYDEALEIVMQEGKASASYIQRRLKIGYNRAARIVEEMEAKGVVGPANGSKPRELIISV